MQTDIELERSAIGGHAAHRIVIDTKFRPILGSGQYGNQRLHSANIYQIYAYLRSQENESDPVTMNSTGVLLYPVIDRELDESAMIQGHEIRFATVNLAADSADIRNQLLRIAESSPLDSDA